MVCTLSKPLDAIVLAGMGAGDILRANGFPTSASVMNLGGEGADTLSGGALSEDVLVDGPDATGAWADTLESFGGDDVLTNNDGVDQLSGGDGNDYFLSTTICDGDTLIGGAGRDNASWSKFSAGIEASIAQGTAGRPGTGSTPDCGAEPLDHLQAIEDLEGSSQADGLYGGRGPNQLWGRDGADTLQSAAGNDLILANAGDSDPSIDCGADNDTAVIDHPPDVDIASNCESIREADPNAFVYFTPPDPPILRGTSPASPANDNSPKIQGSAEAGSSVELYKNAACSGSPVASGSAATFAAPGIAVAVANGSSTTFHATATDAASSVSACSASAARYVEDSTAPNSLITSGPGREIVTKKAKVRVRFTLSATEPRSRFRCKLDKRAFSACGSSRAYKVRAGRHSFRVFATDAAGNRDPTPASRHFKVLRKTATRSACIRGSASDAVGRCLSRSAPASAGGRHTKRRRTQL